MIRQSVTERAFQLQALCHVSINDSLSPFINRLILNTKGTVAAGNNEPIYSRCLRKRIKNKRPPCNRIKSRDLKALTDKDSQRIFLVSRNQSITMPREPSMYTRCSKQLYLLTELLESHFKSHCLPIRANTLMLAGFASAASEARLCYLDTSSKLCGNTISA